MARRAHSDNGVCSFFQHARDNNNNMLPLLAWLILLLLLLGLGLLLHHGLAHMDDDEATSLAKREGLGPWCCYFQPRDVQNHETWIVVCWSNALTLGLVLAWLDGA